MYQQLVDRSCSRLVEQMEMFMAAVREVLDMVNVVAEQCLLHLVIAFWTKRTIVGLKLRSGCTGNTSHHARE